MNKTDWAQLYVIAVACLLTYGITFLAIAHPNDGIPAITSLTTVYILLLFWEYWAD